MQIADSKLEEGINWRILSQEDDRACIAVASTVIVRGPGAFDADLESMFPPSVYVAKPPTGPPSVVQWTTSSLPHLLPWCTLAVVRFPDWAVPSHSCLRDSSSFFGYDKAAAVLTYVATSDSALSCTGRGMRCGPA